jgi:hypothetical protein
VTEIAPEQPVSGATQRPDGLWVFPRKEFTRERFEYKAGQHVVFAGPTQNGKTSLAFDLWEECATPELPAYVCVSKPSDPVSSKRGKQLGFRRVSEWPARKTIKEMREGPPPGYLIWPQFGNMETDVDNARRVTNDFLQHTYANGAKGKKAIIGLDDTYLKSKVLRLDREMTTIHAMAGAMGIGAWTFVQKPTGAGETALIAYGSSDHIFLFKEPDKKNRDRFGEIGGVDPKMVEEITKSLGQYQALYISRKGSYMCIVDKD